MTKAKTRPADGAQLATKLLERFGPSGAGRRLGVAPRSVQRWAEGERTPAPRFVEAMREELAKPKTSPPVQVPPEPVATPVASTLAPPAVERDALTVCRSNVARLERDLEQTEDEMLRAKLSGALTTANTLLAKLTHSMEITQPAIVRSTAWARIESIFERVFARHPEADAALREFVAELQDLGE